MLHTPTAGNIKARGGPSLIALRRPKTPCARVCTMHFTISAAVAVLAAASAHAAKLTWAGTEYMMVFGDVRFPPRGVC
jgi:hypothetical protein